ncbi:hypothetical protein CcCBS67573_g03081 [Chytriomyces confervae]|uniref:Smr domain-containing protein n=1 Tax=Chytriomyces confervae TaxID=246404 RepID=A0A507FGY8_9FUNG|nr:hypothetical protein HDU80_001231 [Chytriomyces hyalinus]TPX75649.1 hypothetical protein CcCBS67573_g03081 [Chytriomyces confervae]
MGNSISQVVIGVIDWSASDKLRHAETLRKSAKDLRQNSVGIKGEARSARFAEADALDVRARALIFAHFNDGRQRTEIDLHGLFVAEARVMLSDRIKLVTDSKLPSLMVITGQGIHSADGVSKLKPMVLELISKLSLSSQVTVLPDTPNKGCITLQFTYPSSQCCIQ